MTIRSLETLFELATTTFGVAPRCVVAPGHKVCPEGNTVSLSLQRDWSPQVLTEATRLPVRLLEAP